MGERYLDAAGGQLMLDQAQRQGDAGRFIDLRKPGRLPLLGQRGDDGMEAEVNFLVVIAIRWR
jgi:hypothetical protein